MSKWISVRGNSVLSHSSPSFPWCMIRVEAVGANRVNTNVGKSVDMSRRGQPSNSTMAASDVTLTNSFTTYANTYLNW